MTLIQKPDYWKNARIIFLACLCALSTVVFAQHAEANSGNKLIEAAKEGNLSEVKRLIAAKADVNAKEMYGKTALMAAESNAKYEVIDLLEQAGAKW